MEIANFKTEKCPAEILVPGAKKDTNTDENLNTGKVRPAEELQIIRGHSNEFKTNNKNLGDYGIPTKVGSGQTFFKKEGKLKIGQAAGTEGNAKEKIIQGIYDTLDNYFSPENIAKCQKACTASAKENREKSAEYEKNCDAYKEKREELQEKQSALEKLQFQKSGDRLKISDEDANRCSELRKEIDELILLVDQLGVACGKIPDELKVKDKNLEFSFEEKKSRECYEDLASYTVSAINLGVLDEDFVKKIYEKFDDIDKKISQPVDFGISIMKKPFENMLNPEYLRQLTEIIKGRRKGDESMQNLLMKNIIYPPYQGDEGSCACSSVLISIWFNTPDKYLLLLDKLISNDVVDLGILKENLKSVNVSEFGNDNDDFERFRQKFLYVVMPLGTTIGHKMLDMKFSICNELKALCKNNEISPDGFNWWGFVEEALENYDLVYDRRFILKEKEHDKNTVSDLIRKIFTKAGREIPADALINLLSEKFFEIISEFRIKEKGTSQKNILYNLFGFENVSSRKVSVTFSEECTFKIDEFQTVLDILKHGSYDKSQSLCPGQLICASYASKSGEPREKGNEDHGFNFISGDFNFAKMKEGDIVKIGNLNHRKNLIHDSDIFMEKMDKHTLRLVYFPCGKKEPITSSTLDSFELYVGPWLKFSSVKNE